MQRYQKYSCPLTATVKAISLWWELTVRCKHLDFWPQLGHSLTTPEYPLDTEWSWELCVDTTGKDSSRAEVTYSFPREAPNWCEHYQESEGEVKGRDKEEDTERKIGAGGMSSYQVKDDSMVVWSGRDLTNLLGRGNSLPCCPTQRDITCVVSVTSIDSGACCRNWSEVTVIPYNSHSVPFHFHSQLKNGLTPSF